MRRILVCGGREYADQAMLFGYLDLIAEGCGVAVIIQGGAKGADFLARMWAKTRGVELLDFPAQWRLHGRRAGPIRNQQMLDEGKPDLVIAFPGGAGTANMVKQARRKRVEVRKVGP